MRSTEVNEFLPAPPAPFRRTAPYRLELRERSGWIAALFGIPFFVTGVFMAFTLPGVLPYEFTPKRDWDFLVLPLMAIAFLGLGGVMLFGRRSVTLDFRRGIAIRTQGLIVPMRREVRSLLEFTAVVLALDSGISDSPDRYPVRLRAKIGKDFVLITPPHFSKARKQAEYLSRSLRLPLADSTSDRETFVSPEQAGDSLRGRLLSGEPETERATPPPGMLCEVTESPEATRIIIPGPRFPRSAVLAAVAPAVVLLLVIAAVGPGSLQNASSRGLPLAFLILILILGIPVIVAGVNLIVGSTRRRTVVRVSSAGLVIERRSAWRTRSKTVAASDILDIDRSTFEHTLQSRGNGTAVLRHLATSTLNKGIVVKSRQEVITFGEELPTGELTYLRCVLRNALAGHWR